MDGCLEEGTVLAFLGGALEPDARSAAEAHIAACAACTDLVTWAAADQATSTARLPGQEGRPFVGQLHPGSRVGRYQILGAVGRGGMGEVYAAYHPNLDRRIALKVVNALGGDTNEGRARLLREARAIARLTHPNVVAVHDAGTFGDRVFIAMEFVDGVTVDDWLRAAPRTWQQILDVFMAAGRGLEAAHAAGVIHRDFKPQNVMIGKDGGVRVMDFGLARLADDAVDDTPGESGSPRVLPIDTVATKTGAFIGTPAYMSPEQLRREKSDARSDQFSFCVALHEALFGARPGTATHDAGSPPAQAPKPHQRPGGVPGWLRVIARRGAAIEKEKRYPSMDALLGALVSGRTRVRRRISAAATAVAVLLLSAGGWRLAHGNRVACAVPTERVAAAWAVGDASDSRRQTIRRAFAATGRATAETSWERVSKVLDEYVASWNAMYLHACEATHLRGEQSAEVLDLRMACLNDNLDQVQALTNTLMTADATMTSRAVTAALDLTPTSRCADIPLLRSEVPLPKDERTLREVQRLRRELAEIQSMHDLGDTAGARARSERLRPAVEATAYKPLLGASLRILGVAEIELEADPSKSEVTLRKAFIAAEESRDDETAAKIASDLAFATGYQLGRKADAEFWVGIAHAILNRTGGNRQDRIRSWVVSNHATVRARFGDFEEARRLFEESIRLKERTVGPKHPDFAKGLSNLAYVLTVAGSATDAIGPASRAVEILHTVGDPDAYSLGVAHANLGEALNGVGRPSDAEAAFRNALQVFSRSGGSSTGEAAFALHGLAAAKLAQKSPGGAIPLFEQALQIREQPSADQVLLANTQFGLARALWESGGDRRRARHLATAALKAYSDNGRTGDRRNVETWLRTAAGPASPTKGMQRSVAAR